MRRLASIALLGTLTLITFNAHAQMRGGGGGGVRSSGGGSFNGGGMRMSSPAPRVSSGRSFGAPSGQVFRGSPQFRTQGVPVNRLNSQNRTVFANRNAAFVTGPRRFNSPFFHHHVFFNSGFNGFFGNGFFGANCFGTFAFGNPFCGNSFSAGFLFGDPFFGLGYPGPAYGYGYGPGYISTDYYPQETPVSNDNQVALTTEIQRLSDEIDDLRDDRNRDRNSNQNNSDQQASSSNGTLTVVPPAANTIFILRDGRRFTAKNYAISGQTLWILNDQSARKTPLSDVDREATEKANAANGIEMHLPEPK